MNNLVLSVVCCFLMALNAGCASQGDVKGRDFEMSSVMKNDIDLVAETHQRVVFNALRQLAIKLYKRNPQEWKKAGQPSLEMAVKTITANPLPLIANISNIEQIRLAFDERYQGDRVKAYIVGLEAMVLASYDNHRSFYTSYAGGAKAL